MVREGGGAGRRTRDLGSMACAATRQGRPGEKSGQRAAVDGSPKLLAHKLLGSTCGRPPRPVGVPGSMADMAPLAGSRGGVAGPVVIADVSRPVGRGKGSKDAGSPANRKARRLDHRRPLAIEAWVLIE